MKKLITLALALVFLTACQEQPQRWTATSPEIDVTKALIKDYQEGNWESWIGHYADTAKVYHNSTESISAQQLSDGFKQTLADYSSYGFSDEETYIEMIIDNKNEKWVYFWGNWKGTVSETEKELTIPVHLALQFADTKIVEEYALYDTSAITKALKEKEAARMNEEGYQSNFEIVKGVYDNFAKGDIPAFLAVLDPKVEWNEADNFIYADGSVLMHLPKEYWSVLEQIGNIGKLLTCN
jgi:ketosteroid isomerase-like protein